MHRLKKHHKIAYFDYASTTPADPRVVEAMADHWGPENVFGNPSSIQHNYGTEASRSIEFARRQVAKFINARSSEIVWTSGATEANNIAIRGFLRSSKKGKGRLVTLATEHNAVLDTAKSLKTEGFEVEILPVRKSGIVDLDTLSKTLKLKKTSLVSVMWVNNETGVMQPIAEIAKLCKKYGAAFHVDAAQAVGKVEINLKSVSVDLLSISGHKVYGPKGIGSLYVRTKTPLKPLVTGGGQEKGIRPGTLPTPLIVGLGKAIEIISKEYKSKKPHLKISAFHEKIKKTALDLGAKINGDVNSKIPHILNIRVDRVSGDPISLLRDVAVSNGAACTTEKMIPSHVLRAMGFKKREASKSLRISFGRFTTEAEILLLKKSLKGLPFED